MYEYEYNPLVDDGPPPKEIEEVKRQIRAKWSEAERASRVVGASAHQGRWTPPTVDMKALVGCSECRAYTRIA